MTSQICENFWSASLTFFVSFLFYSKMASISIRVILIQLFQMVMFAWEADSKWSNEKTKRRLREAYKNEFAFVS